MKKIFKCVLTAVLFLSVGTNVYAEGEETQDNDESTQIVTDVSETDVAKIGDKGYETLQAAIDDAGETKTTITLVNNVTNISTVKVDKKQNIILDLNGKTVSTAVKSNDSSQHYYAIENKGTLEINDSSEVGTGKISSRGIDNYGTLTINGGTFETIDSNNGGAAVYNDYEYDSENKVVLYESKLYVNGGTFKVTNGQNDSDLGAQCIYNDGKATITGGVFESNSKRSYAISSNNELTISPAEGKQVNVSGVHGGVGVDSGTAVINGGTFESAEYYGLYVSNDGYGEDPLTAAVTVNGGTFKGASWSVWIGSDYNNPVNSTIEITGGTFENKINAQDNTRENALVVKGGSFVENVTDYLADGYHINEVDGKYVVQQTVVAEINGVKYSTVQKAIDANDKVTINVVADTAENITIPSGKTIILNIANDVTITNNGGHTITNNGTLTIAGAGTIDNITHQKGALVNNVDATATLEGSVKYTRSQEAGASKVDSGENSWYNISNQGSMRIRENTTVTSTGHFSSLIRNGDLSSGDAVLVIENGTFSGGINTVKNGDFGTLTIQNGKFSNTTQATVLNWNVANIYGGTFTTAEDASDSLLVGKWIQYTVSKPDHYEEPYLYTTEGKTCVYGGDFTGGVSQYHSDEYIGQWDKGTYSITGGTFSVDVSEYLADGYNLAKIGEKYVVVKKGENAPVTEPITPAVDDKAFDEISKSEDIPENATVTSVELEASEVSKENLNEEETKKVEEKVVDAITEAKTAKILLPLNINLKATTETKVDGVTTGTKEVNVTKLNKAITATIYLDDATLAELAGKTIKVVRVHTEDGKTEYTVLDATLTGNALSFETDKFSNYYVVTYATEIKDEPKPSVSPEPEEPVEPVEPEEKIVFIDVDEKTDHNESIDWLAGTGVSEGWKNSDGTREFRPYAEVARADMAAFLKRLGTNCFDDTTAFTPSEEDWATFTDVVAAKSEQDQYHQEDILWLAKYKISEGWAVGTTREFRPFEKVTRADMAAFLRRLAKKYDLGDANTWEPSEEDWTTFKDVVAATSELDQYHQEDILWLAHAKISTGFSDGTFRPFETVKRCDMAAFLQRLAKLD